MTDIEKEQTRELVFVGYSYGGLVIKQALVRAFEKADYGKIAKQTRGILFLGTPHRGSAFSWTGWLMALALRPLGSNPLLLAEIEHRSKALLDLDRHFQSMLNTLSNKVKVFHFFERRPTPIARLWLYQWNEYVGSPP